LPDQFNFNALARASLSETRCFVRFAARMRRRDAGIFLADVGDILGPVLRRHETLATPTARLASLT